MKYFTKTAVSANLLSKALKSRDMTIAKNLSTHTNLNHTLGKMERTYAQEKNILGMAVQRKDKDAIVNLVKGRHAKTDEWRKYMK